MKVIIIIITTLAFLITPSGKTRLRVMSSTCIPLALPLKEALSLTNMDQLRDHVNESYLEKSHLSQLEIDKKQELQ